MVPKFMNQGPIKSKNQAPEMKKYPSINEFQGLFNINLRQNKIKTKNGNGYLNRPGEIPPLSRDEINDIIEKVYLILRKHAVPDYVKKEYILDFLSYCVNSSRLDRTLSVLLPDFSVSTKKLLQKLQKELRINFPLWRIILVTTDYGNSIIVYPETIRFGIPKNGLKKEQLLNETLSKESNDFLFLNKKKFSKMRIAQSKLAQFKEELVKSHWKVVCLQNKSVETNQTIEIWVAYVATKEHALDIVGDYEIISGATYAVDEDFTFNDYQKTSKINTWITYWIIPKETPLVSFTLSSENGETIPLQYKMNREDIVDS